MPPNTVAYRSAPEQPDPAVARRRIALVLGWFSVAAGGLAVGFLPFLMAARESIAGFLVAPMVWLVALAAVVTAGVAIVLRRRVAIAWVGLALGVFGLVWCTVYMAIPPTRRDF
jgi:hypothetical protein